VRGISHFILLAKLKALALPLMFDNFWQENKKTSCFIMDFLTRFSQCSLR